MGFSGVRLASPMPIAYDVPPLLVTKFSQVVMLPPVTPPSVGWPSVTK